MTIHVNACANNPVSPYSHYATYVGRVGALAVALGIGAAMATGHGLGLGVAYATEGDPGADTSQDGGGDNGEGDGDATPASPPAATVTPGGSSQRRAPLARIANVPRMIFNATGGAQTSKTNSTQPRLPRLSTVLEDVASAVTNNLPKVPESAQGTAARAITGTESNVSDTSRSASTAIRRNFTPAVTALPASVANEFKALVRAPAGAPTPPRPTVTPVTAPVGIQRQALVDNGQQDVAQPSATLVQTPTNHPPISPVGVVTRLMTVAFAAVVAPGPAAPTDPPLLLGVLAWARREIQINFFNRTPNAIPDVVETGEDNPYAGNVLTNDRAQNPDGSTEKLIVTDARTQTTDKGTLVLNADGSYVYTPKPDANGQDVFTYTVSDEASRPHIHGLSGLLYGGGHTDTGTLTINIRPVNDAPVATDDTRTIDEDSPQITGNVLTNDTDIDTDHADLTVTPIITTTTKGTLNLQADGTYTYTPLANANGQDVFTYTVSDNDPTNPQTDTATLTINITPVNDAPEAGTDSAFSTNEDTAYSGTLPVGSDIDGDLVAYSIEPGDGPSHGTISGFNATTGAYTYTPAANYNGPDAFTYTVSDGHGGTDTATVSITVNAVNDAPVAVNDTFFTPAGTALTITRAQLTANDSDADGDALTPAIVDSPSHGTLSVVDGHYEYTPDDGFTGVDQFTYVSIDGHGGVSELATVSINVGPSVEGLLNMTGTPVTDPVALTSDKITMTVQPNGSLIAGDSGLVYDDQEFVVWGTPVWNHSVTYNGQDYYQAANGYSSSGFTSVTTEDISNGSFHGVKTTEIVGGDLKLERVIGFYDGDDYAIIATRVTNIGSTDLNNVAIMENTDPDQGIPTSNSYYTNNDVVLGGQLVRASYTNASYPGGLTLGFGSADPRAVASAEGFSNTSPYAIINSPEDPNGASDDIGINLATNYGTLAPGQSASSGMLVVLGKSITDADQTYQNAAYITQPTV